jgi:hypothetical protein
VTTPQIEFLRREAERDRRAAERWTPALGRRYGITEAARERHVAELQYWARLCREAAERAESGGRRIEAES